MKGFCKGRGFSERLPSHCLSCLLEKTGLGPPGIDVAIPLLSSPSSGHGQLRVMPLPGLLQAFPHLCVRALGVRATRRESAHRCPGSQAIESIISENLGDISSNLARKP